MNRIFKNLGPRKRQPEPMPSVPSERRQVPPIPPVEGAKYNICLTDALNDRKRPVWTHRNLKTVPWTTVLDLPALAAVRTRAHAIYKQMTAAGSLCPLVTLHGSGVRLEFEMEGMRAIYVLYPGSTLFGFGRINDPYPSGDVDEGLAASRLGVTT